MKVAVIDYGAGNVRSVLYALERLSAPAILTSDKQEILSASHVIFPGVGEASSAMAQLEKRGLIPVLREVKAPFLGICLGMQLMNGFSEEGNVDLLSLTDERVTRFPEGRGYKIPHIGWNSIAIKDDPLFRYLEGGEYMYFVHSYYVPQGQYTIASCEYDDVTFSAAIRKGNFAGCQFHPEKSAEAGERILKAFLEEGTC